MSKYYKPLTEKWAGDIKQDAYIRSVPLADINCMCPATLVQLSQNMVPGMFVAGGSCMTIMDPMHKFTDIDIWVTSPEVRQHVEGLLAVWGLAPKHDHGNGVVDWADELVSVQIIQANELKSIEDLISTFDIEACKIGFDSTHIAFGAYTKAGIRDKDIEIVNRVSEDPVAMILRILKYVSKGYTIKAEIIKDIWTKNKKVKLNAGDIATETNVQELRDMFSKLLKEQVGQYTSQPLPVLPLPPLYTYSTNAVKITYNCNSCGLSYQQGSQHACPTY